MRTFLDLKEGDKCRERQRLNADIAGELKGAAFSLGPTCEAGTSGPRQLRYSLPIWIWWRCCFQLSVTFLVLSTDHLARRWTCRQVFRLGKTLDADIAAA
jgi:hypothetical protein